ncbi:phosphate butyryltransferase [Mangrovibacillus cuniculi]|uniref:Phosphate butyryltransferase n=1 Tax=Mangrovibacillus cuniculi TaxID=2593652 RepID=A0A7S8CB97_9BACI|nr:phosphate butyryltransferase [Mangrovibacillus cuniculi]QPC46810.1 phosphate butyryltransferase [Mangrovibacillus cuniculi]
MSLEHFRQRARSQSTAIVAVADAADLEVLESVQMAVREGLASFLLFGNESKMVHLAKQSFPELLSTDAVTFVPTQSATDAATKAVQSVSSGEATVLMKGHVPTATLLKAVLNKEWGLRTGAVLSHVAAFEVDGFERLIWVTDAAMNIAPDLTQKAQIIQNSISIATSVGINKPKVAVLTAVEVVNPSMQATLDAAALVQMASRGQIKGASVDGPLALDNAISITAAEHKGIKGEVAGNADILMVPTIEAGNVLYKSLVYFANAKVGAVIAGAKAPIVLTSRADSAESKLYSLALAICTTSN